MTKAADKIEANIRDEFQGVRNDSLKHLDPLVPVEQARLMLAEHVPALVLGRAQILLGSLLGYLMSDAMDDLATLPVEVQNEFYDRDFRAEIGNAFSFKPNGVELSFDPSRLAGLLSAGGTVAVGGLLGGLTLGGLVSRVVAGFVTISLAAASYKLGQSAVRSHVRGKLHSDLDNYLALSEREVSRWLAEVREEFESAFARFRDEGELASGATR